jgi:dolichyl-diphosphooligosaccharide--protein glycosyltransferase
MKQRDSGSTPPRAAAAPPPSRAWTRARVIGRLALSLAWRGACLAGVARALSWSFAIRLHAVRTYGEIVHEFDPYFHFRAAEYRLVRRVLSLLVAAAVTPRRSVRRRHRTRTIRGGPRGARRYLDRHGARAFFSWFDHASWYPLGRPVGTTIYPGLQVSTHGPLCAVNTYPGRAGSASSRVTLSTVALVSVRRPSSSGLWPRHRASGSPA